MKNYTIKLLIWSFAAQTSSLCSIPDYALAFVHLGTKVPEYAIIAIQQARLFNECPLYFIAPQHDIERLRSQLVQYDVECVAAESLVKTQHHQKFLSTSRLDSHWEGGFWRYTTERFFYLEELITTYNLRSVFHIENDVMVYANLGDLLPILRHYYKGIAMTFGWDMVGVAGFMYIPALRNIREITLYMTQHAASGKDDGTLLAQIKDERGPDCIDYLPVIFPEYAARYELINASGCRARNPERFYQHAKEFNGIFDAGALSQFLTGISPRNGSLPAGYVNTHCVFDVRHLGFSWEQDAEKRNQPYASFGSAKYPIIIFHVHSKQLERARS